MRFLSKTLTSSVIDRVWNANPTYVFDAVWPPVKAILYPIEELHWFGIREIMSSEIRDANEEG